MARLRALLWCCLILCASRAGASTHCAAVMVEVDLPARMAWELLSDFSLAHNYVPDLTATEIMSSQRQGVGAHRRVYQSGGDYLEETITQWYPGSGFVIRLHKAEQPMAPFERALFTYRLDEVATKRTLVTLSLQVDMPWGIVGDWLGEWVITPLLRKNLVQIAAGMKYFYETGQPATDNDRERLAPLVQIPEGGC